jgi:cobalt-zinc-cadmium efflux system protein
MREHGAEQGLKSQQDLHLNNTETHSHEHGHDYPHGHDHHHSHGQVMLNQRLNSAFIIAIILNSILTVLQIIYAYLAHSTSLLADAGHHLSDVLALIFSFIAILLVKKNANQRYSYGYKKSTILATLTNATLLVIACTVILMEAIDHLIYQHTVAPIPVMIVAALGAIVSGISALLLHKDSQHDLNIKSAFLHLWYDALLSIGVVITGALIYFTHISIFDPIVGILLALFILKNSWQLFKETLNLSLDGVPKHIDLVEVAAFLQNIPGVTKVHDLHIWALSTSSNALTVHLIRPQGLLSSEERKHLSHDLQHRFHIDHTTIQVETHEETDCEHHQSC